MVNQGLKEIPVSNRHSLETVKSLYISNNKLE
jgi:hypothetical protein